MRPGRFPRALVGALLAATALAVGAAEPARTAPGDDAAKAPAPARAATKAAAPPAAPAPSPLASASGEVDPRAVARRVADFDRALRAGDFALAKSTLDAIAAMLPERSLTLLRLQAWYAHRSGDADGAMALYGEVLQRLPQDRNAAINLAMLEAERGDVDRASQRLRDLRSVAGESAELAAAMARVGAMPR